MRFRRRATAQVKMAQASGMINREQFSGCGANKKYNRKLIAGAK
jgi:hypothetical protein